MKIGITGLANSGKSTIFNSLTRLGVSTPSYAATSGEPHLGMAKVPDERIDRLAEIFKPKKVTYATVQFVDYIGLTRGDAKQNRSVCEFVKDADALVHVIRAFEDEGVLHPLGSLDPLRDARTVEAELILGDMELVEKRLENMDLALKKGSKPSPEERALLEKCQAALNDEISLRDVSFTNEERVAMRHLQFMSIKPQVVVLNIGEHDLNSDQAAAMCREVERLYKGSVWVKALALSGKIEMEIAELPSEEARAFLEDLGIQEPALNRLIRACYENIGLISFLTVGEDEVRSWPVRKGSDAHAAAGKVHSDIQRGFIRAEVISYEDFMKVGSLAAGRDKGLLRLEGKTYPVTDGDIIHFRFNV